MDKAAVTRQFEIGYQALGAEFAVGDGEFNSPTNIRAMMIWWALLYPPDGFPSPAHGYCHPSVLTPGIYEEPFYHLVSKKTVLQRSLGSSEM